MPPAEPSADTIGHTTNLPTPASSFVGRDAEVAEVRQLLGRTRLLTLTGPGGIGKTRLALEAARGVQWAYPDGVWLVELAALTDPALVPQAVATALGIPEEPTRSVTDTLAQVLGARHLLLVLDNCEHLVAACAQLADTLLRAAPGLQLLATSREGLRVTGETRYRVPSLSLPNRASLPPADQLTQYEAILLFVERARAASPGFAVTDATALAVTDICARLDGIPLAIELAAVRVAILSVEQIADRLADRFRLLTSGSRTALPRQQTLRAALDWSWQLLPLSEQVLLRRLAVFAGGWSLEAAETVCADDVLATGTVLELLTTLVDKSFVAVDRTEREVRYGMLETIRQFAAEQLVSVDERAVVQQAHARYFLALAEQAGMHLTGPEQASWLRRLATDDDNLRAAMQWAADAGEAEVVLRLAGCLWRYWQTRGHAAECRAWLAQSLAAASGAPLALRIPALFGAGVLALATRDVAGARTFFEGLLAAARAMPDQLAEAAALTQLGHVAVAENELERAHELLDAALAIRRDQGETRGIAISLSSLAEIAERRGEIGTALILREEARTLFERCGDTRSLADCLYRLSYLTHSRGAPDEARVLAEASLRLFEDIEDLVGISRVLQTMGAMAFRRGDVATAAAYLARSLTAALEAGDAELVKRRLEHLMKRILVVEHPVPAAVLLGALEARLTVAGAALRTGVAPVLSQQFDGLNRRLGQATTAAARVEGRARSLEEAIAEALAVAAKALP